MKRKFDYIKEECEVVTCSIEEMNSCIRYIYKCLDSPPFNSAVLLSALMGICTALAQDQGVKKAHLLANFSEFWEDFEGQK